jgi:acyl-CoA thioesterase FadM
VHSEVDFLDPLHFGDRLHVRVTCSKLGRSSLGLRYRFLRDDTLCVDARMTTVCVNMDGLKPVPIPAEFRQSFEQILESAP